MAYYLAITSQPTFLSSVSLNQHRSHGPIFIIHTVFGVEPEQDTILSLKLRLQEQHGIPVSQKALCLSRKEEHGPSPIDARATFVYEYATPFCIL